MQEDEKYKGIVGKPEEKGSLGRLEHIWEDDIKMEHEE